MAPVGTPHRGIHLSNNFRGYYAPVKEFMGVYRQRIHHTEHNSKQWLSAHNSVCRPPPCLVVDRLQLSRRGGCLSLLREVTCANIFNT